MNSGTSSPRTSLWVSAWLLLVGQLFYILVTQLHAGGAPITIVPCSLNGRAGHGRVDTDILAQSYGGLPYIHCAGPSGAPKKFVTIRTGPGCFANGLVS